MQAPCLCHVGWLVSLASKALNPTLHLTHNMCANNRALATYVLPILSGSVGIMDVGGAFTIRATNSIKWCDRIHHYSHEQPPT